MIARAWIVVAGAACAVGLFRQTRNALTAPSQC
jgi:hypothetical protein